MAYPPARYGYHQSHAEADIPRDARQYFADPEQGVLEPALLNTGIMQPPDSTRLRKGSFVNNSDILTSGDPHHWDAQYAGSGGSLAIEGPSTGPPPYHDDHQRFNQEPNHSMPAPYGHAPQPQAWSFESGSGNCTPTNRMDFEHPPAVNGPFDHPHYVHQRNDSAHGSFSHPPPRSAFNGAEESFIPAPQVHTPMSPHSHQDWMTMAAQESESKPHPRRMGVHSPHPPTVDFQRRDGIRKKNARIDIPHERSIQTIEQMLETTTDEELLKELKQQKRLLRNREAALASRQRKKKHTEDLELKEKEFNRSIEGYITENNILKRDNASFHHNNQILVHQIDDLRRNVDMLEQEKSELKRTHENETSILRKRLHTLQDEIQYGLAPAMSAAPSSTGFADFNAGMEALNMGVQEWDDLIFASDLQNELLVDDLSFDHKPEQISQPVPIERSSMPAAPSTVLSKSSTDGSSDQTVTSGLLFFLLLCGAFVASKPPSSQPSDMPQVPADVRAAAPKVLNNLLFDGQGSTMTATVRPAHLEESGPSASTLPHSAPKPRSRIDRIHRSLTAPTRQQEIDSAFSLTTQEYASIAHLDYPLSSAESSTPRLQSDAPPPRPRRNLAEALANMQDDSSRNSKAEVYTRSLLWEQIPTDVVKQFRELVRDHNEIEARQQQQQRQDHDEMTEFKLET